jgi:hypothetical protein
MPSNLPAPLYRSKAPSAARLIGTPCATPSDAGEAHGPGRRGAGGTERTAPTPSQQGGDEEGDYQEKQIQTNEDEKASTHAIDDTCPCPPQSHGARDETDSSEDDGDENEKDQRPVLAMSLR